MRKLLKYHVQTFVPQIHFTVVLHCVPTKVFCHISSAVASSEWWQSGCLSSGEGLQVSIRFPLFLCAPCGIDIIVNVCIIGY